MDVRVQLILMLLISPLGLSVRAAPIEAYARLPLYENVALSPDGKYLAYVTTVGEEREAIIQALDISEKAPKGARVKAGSHKLRDLYWAGNQQLIVVYSQSTDFWFGEQFEVGGVNNYDFLRKETFSPMLWRREGGIGGFRGWPHPRVINGRPFLFSSGWAYRTGGDFALIKSDLSKQVNKVVDVAPVQAPTKGYVWTVDHEGHPVVLSGYHEETQTWIVYIKKAGEWRVAHKEKAPVEIPAVLGLGVEPGTVLVTRPHDGAWVIQPFFYDDGRWGAPLNLEHCCFANIIVDPVSNRAIGYSWKDHRRHYHFWSDTLQQRWQQVLQSFPGDELFLESWSANLDKAVVRVFGKTKGAAYVLVDLQKKQLSTLGNLYLEIESKDLAKVKPVTFDAQDGLKIPGYLTLPNDREVKNLPLIVMPHGGPAVRDDLTFDWLAQALAAKGYLVLQPNFRGSFGVNRAHYEAGFGEFGRKMQTDLSDGARALIKSGIAHPQKICILGASYGGYAALQGVVLEPDFYRCAISVAGISDLNVQLNQQFETKVSKESPRFRHIMRYFGAETIESPVIADRSPANNVKQIKVPVLLLHGDQDAVVQFAQSKIMADALRKAKKQYEFVQLKSEDHWLSKSATRMQALQEIVRFLDAHNPP